MIDNGLVMIGVIMALAATLIVLERKTESKFFKYVPGMVLMYLLCATLLMYGLGRIHGKKEALEKERLLRE